MVALGGGRAFRRAALAALAAASLLLAAACTTDSASDSGANRNISVKAANGDVRITESPERVVSLSPTATEMLFDIGAGEQVVAVDDQSSYPDDAPRTSLSGLTPSADAIAAYRPDLVVVDADRNGVVAALNKLDVPVLVEPAATKLDDSYDQLIDLGTATDNTDAAEKVVTQLKATLAEAVERVKDAPRRSYFHELDNTYFSVTSATFVGSIYGLFKLDNIADAAAPAGNDYPQLNAEYIVRSNPDLIFLADGACCGQSAQTVAQRPGWGQLTAVQRDQVISLDADTASRWGPRVVEFAEDVATAIDKAAANN
ncbi:MAG: ABC transporter substrate-binding protein [Mycobacteriales bacterium]